MKTIIILSIRFAKGCFGSEHKRIRITVKVELEVKIRDRDCVYTKIDNVE